MVRLLRMALAAALIAALASVGGCGEAASADDVAFESPQDAASAYALGVLTDDTGLASAAAAQQLSEADLLEIRRYLFLFQDPVEASEVIVAETTATVVAQEEGEPAERISFEVQAYNAGGQQIRVYYLDFKREIVVTGGPDYVARIPAE